MSNHIYQLFLDKLLLIHHVFDKDLLKELQLQYHIRALLHILQFALDVLYSNNLHIYFVNPQLHFCKINLIHILREKQLLRQLMKYILLSSLFSLCIPYMDVYQGYTNIPLARFLHCVKFLYNIHYMEHNMYALKVSFQISFPSQFFENTHNKIFFIIF